jgi:inhibitor of KinA sporulation pathway (predicted exonuclease)
MDYIVLDLEATCWKNNFGKVNEIIEIGALKFNKDGAYVDEFSAFVRPRLNPILSEFCKQLTSIKQEDTDRADDFPTVINEFIHWIGKEYTLLSWGAYDKNQLIKDCRLHDLDHDWVMNHINIKQKHAKIKNLGKPCGMEIALAIEGFQLEGIHHRGIDDARNTAKIFLKYFNQMIN